MSVDNGNAPDTPKYSPAVSPSPSSSSSSSSSSLQEQEQEHDSNAGGPPAWDGRRAAIHFAFPQRPVAHTGYSFAHEPREPSPTVWQTICDKLGRLYDRYNEWLDEKKQQLHLARRMRGRSRSMAETPFCMAAFIAVYATFMLFRGIAVEGWVVDLHDWDGSGRSFDQHAVITISALEKGLLSMGLVCGIATWLSLIFKTRAYVYYASRWCAWLACIEGSTSLLTVVLFFHRCSDSMAANPEYAYSRGFWSCLISGVLMLFAAAGFTLDWLLSYPYSELTPMLNALVLPAVMVCSVVSVGASVYSVLEDWTYSEALIFCWTAVTTIGYGDITPATPQGKGFFLLYTASGVCVVGYMLLSIRAVVTGTSSDILKVNLMRVESLHDYSRRQHQKWLDHHGNEPNRSVPQYYSTSSNDNRDFRRRTTLNNSRARRRLSSNVSTFSNYTISNILNDEDRQILVQVITRSGVVRMTFILVLCWFGGAGIFCLLEEDWSYLDALYFAFCTQLTIGFGDIVPQSVLAQEFWLFYIVISIAVAAYFISLFGDALVEKLQIQYDDELDDESEGSGSLNDNGNEPSYVTLAHSLDDEDASVQRCLTETPEPIQPSTMQGRLPVTRPRRDSESMPGFGEREPLVRYASMPTTGGTSFTRRSFSIPPQLYGMDSIPDLQHPVSAPFPNVVMRSVSYDSIQESTSVIRHLTPPSPVKHPCSPLDIPEATGEGRIGPSAQSSPKPGHGRSPQHARTKKASKYNPIAVTSSGKSHRGHL